MILHNIPTWRVDVQIIKSSILLFICGASVSACGDLETLLSTSQEIVFNELNVDQPRGHLAYVQQNVASPEFEQEATSVGLMNRATGVVTQDRCPAQQNGEQNQLSIGTGSLTSSTRLTTALHVLNHEAADVTIEVTFGTLDISNLADVLTSGDYVADQTPDSIHAFDESLRYGAFEEEPFLAMRLFQLGLDEWAVKGNQTALYTRNRLRKWDFAYDEIPGVPRFTQLLPNSARRIIFCMV